MSKTDDLIKHLEGQGAEVRRTKKGLVIRAPGGGTTAMHFTPSDHRAIANNKAALRRIGLTHPEDKKPERKKSPRNDEGYPDYIYGGDISNAARKKLLAALDLRDWPLEITVHALVDDGAGHQTTVAKGLYQIGYRWHPNRKRVDRAYIWVAPNDIRELHEKRMREKNVERIRDMVTPDPEPEPECTHQAWEEMGGGARRCADCHEFLPPIEDEAPEETAPVTAQIPEPEPGLEPEPTPAPEVKVKTDGVREFIDSVDSWTVDIRKPLFGHDPIPAAMRQYLAGLRAAGLEVEIRVWRERNHDES